MPYHSEPTDSNKQRNQYREFVSSLDIPVQDIDAMIDIVHDILCYFVDRAFNVHSDQITLGIARGMSFAAPSGYAMIEHHPDNRSSDAPSDGVDRDSNPRGSEP
jgi:hypothetical protein